MQTVLSVIGLFVLRLGVPVVAMVLLAWAVNWYKRHEEIRALEARNRAAEQSAAGATVSQNGAEERIPVR